MFYNILDRKRTGILPLLGNFKKDFYLAGGTALALQIGHRDSVDFDFFCAQDLDTKRLFSRLEKVFIGHKIVKTQEENNTLGVFIDGKIKLSFMSFAYPLVGKCADEKYLRLLSIADIGCMKLSTITGRAANKDYIDLCFILRRLSLAALLKKSTRKFPSLDENLILKSLVYFDDIAEQPIIFKNQNKISFKEVKEYLIGQVREYWKNRR